MDEKVLKSNLDKFEKYLMYEVENSDLTVKKYVSEAKKFLIWLYDEKCTDVSKISKKLIVDYKQYLCERYDNSDTINGKLGMNHIFLNFIGKGRITIKRLKVVKRNCKPKGRYIKESDYKKLIKCNKMKFMTAMMVSKIIANTGVKVSEVSQITYEMIVADKIIVNNKGKIREIVLIKHIKKDLKEYCERVGINTGFIILNKQGKTYTRYGIWPILKNLAKEMEVDDNIVFPHSFRHLFVVKHYSIHKDIEALVNILGHSSTETTLIYLRKTVEEYSITMDIWQ